MVTHLFDILVAMHIVTGSVGLVCLWVPVVGRKGTPTHKKWGKVFARSMLATGSIAIGISLCTLYAPLETHPFWDDPRQIRGVFGWMMLYLATLTVNLAWHGWLCINNRRDHRANRAWHNLLLQVLLTGLLGIILLVLGMFFDPTGIVLLTAPIFFPIVTSLGFDPLWFAILFVINMELAFITPPFGFNLFYMKAVLPPDVSMMAI